jgi:uncharacterized protein YceK
MKSNRVKLQCLAWIAIISILFLSVSGCATVETISSATYGSPMVYSGTRLDVHTLSGSQTQLLRLEEKYNIHPPKYPLADLPFSFLLDSLIFPLTSSVALYNLVFE